MYLYSVLNFRVPGLSFSKVPMQEFIVPLYIRMLWITIIIKDGPNLGAYYKTRWSVL